MGPVPEDPAAEILREVGATFAVSLQAPVLLRNRRAQVVRAQLSGSAPGPTHVIIKRFAPGLREHFLRERAGLRVLGGIAELQGFVPRLLADAEPTSTLLIEAIPHQTSLMEILDAPRAGTDESLAVQALTITAARLGTLHGHARRAVPAFAALAPATPDPAAVFRDGLPATLAFCQRVLAPAAALEGSDLHAALTDLADQVAEAAALVTITSGDMAPSNVLLGPHGPAFIDFEFCGLRHPFYDAMFWRCICPFPEAVADRMDAFYREGLRRTGLALSDDRFHRELLLFTSHRLFWGLGWIKDGLFDRDQDFVPGISGRWLTRRYLGDYLRLAARRPALAQPLLVRTADQLAGRLARLWPEADPARELTCFTSQ
jgi:hypothetical protein